MHPLYLTSAVMRWAVHLGVVHLGVVHLASKSLHLAFFLPAAASISPSKGESIQLGYLGEPYLPTTMWRDVCGGLASCPGHPG